MRKFLLLAGIFLVFWSLCSTITVQAQQLAFPGAEGFGRLASGGRGGAVYAVTNLNDSGPGSLRDAVSKSGARTIVFRVSGTITLQSSLNISNGNITIAGQTAPGDGITIKNFPVNVNADNVIVRYLRFRMGDEAQQEADALGGRFYKNIIVDHCSMSWSTDECVSFYANENTTVQWSIVSESLRNSIHDKGSHGFGGIWGGKNASFHHNLLAHHDSRNPRFGEEAGKAFALTDLVDYRNNVLYNWGGNSAYGGEAMNINMVNNYYKPGPATIKRERIFSPDKNRVEGTEVYDKWGKFYIDGNYVEGSTRATQDNWTYGVYNQFHSTYGTVSEEDKAAMRRAEPHPINNNVVTHSATEAYDLVLQQAGASIVRDAVDARVIDNVRNGTYTAPGSKGSTNGIIDSQADVGGWPALQSSPAPQDTDADGMSDAWEQQNGLNPNDPSDRNNYGSNGFTMLENYLNSFTNAPVSTDPVIYAAASFTAFTQTIGQPSPSQTFQISGYNLSSDINITAPANYQLSLDGTAWSSSLTLTANSGSVSSTTVRVRLNASSNGTYNGIISAASSGAETINMEVKGTTYTPAVVSMSGNLIPFTQMVGTPSASQSFTVQGSNLTANVSVSAPSGFDLSADNTNWHSSLSLVPENNSVNATAFVRMNATTAGLHSGNIRTTSSGATSDTLAVSGVAASTQMSIPQEKLLYSTDFQDWARLTSTTEVVVSKKTEFTNENLNFKFFQVNVDPTGENLTRFNYSLVSRGWAQAQKIPGSYMELSPLKSITKVQFVQGATGTNRGFKVWKKGLLDALWVPVYTTPCATPSGEVVTVAINEPDVAIRFTNIDDLQNAYMFDLKIYGNYASTKPQYRLDVTPNIPEAGTITKTPNYDTYDEGMTVKLQANRNFGYRFVRWADSLGNVLSTANPYDVTMDVNKKLSAVFDTLTTYAYRVNITGSKWAEVQLAPQPVNGTYETGTRVTMKAIPNAVTNFSKWEDNSTTLQRVITVNENKSFTATFDEIPFITGWNFKASTPTVSRTGDFYSETTNIGMISAHDPNGSPVSWAANTSTLSPSYPGIRFNTPAAEFKTKRRYLQADFSALNRRNIRVSSLVSAISQAYSVQVLQYSLDNVNFTELARADITNVFNVGWEALSATLPADAEGKKRVYIRWVADTTSPILGSSASADGTSFANIFVYADKYTAVDTVAPVLIAAEPVDGSKTAAINGTIVLNFDETMKAGNGSITLGSTVLSGTFGPRTVSFNYEKLNYNSQYTVTVPAGVLTDLAGNPFPGTTFTFNTSVRSQPTKKMFDAVVAQDGSGDYPSVALAVAAAPINRTAPWLIYIKNGKYTGHVDILSNKPFIHLIGQSRDSVIISDNRLAGEDGNQTTPTFPVQQGATVYVNAPDCYFENLTIENSFGYEKQAGPQALALFSDCDRFTTNNVWLRSYQDTWLTTYGRVNNRHYVKNSKIEGAVDFIYGGGDVFFDKSTITCTRKDGGYIVAPSHQTGTLWGYVFSHCTIDEAHASGVTTYYGRPWHQSPKTVFLYTTLKAKVYPKGWYYKMNAIPAVFADYGTMDSSGNMVDLSYRIEDYEYNKTDSSGNIITVKGKAKNSLTDAEAATYTYDNVVIRTGSKWDPRMLTEAPEKPGKVLLKESTISWKDIPYSRLYIVFRDKKVHGFTTSSTYTDSSAVSGNIHTYAVQAVSEYGALSEMTNAVDDTISPVVRVKNIAVALDSSGKVAITAEMIDNGSSDESGIESMSLDKTDFDCSNIGENQVRLTVTDTRGNTSSGTAVVTVKDSIAPTVRVKNTVLTLRNGMASLSASDIDDGSTDVCGLGSFAINRTSFNCSDIGEQPVTLTVTDKSGNYSTAVAMVKIGGSVPSPSIIATRSDSTFTGAGAKTIFLGYGAQSLSLNAFDNTSASNITYRWSPASDLSATDVANPVFTPKTAGTYTFTVTATNEYGCSGSSTISIEVLDARCGDMKDKILVCHHGQLICISPADVKMHLSHGCSIARCNSTGSGATTSSINSEAVIDNSFAGGDIKKGIKAYPNPVSGFLSVQFPLNKDARYSIDLIDLNGSSVSTLDKGQSGNNDEYLRRFDVSALKSGLYLLRIVIDKVVSTEKIIIN